MRASGAARGVTDISGVIRRRFLERRLGPAHGPATIRPCGSLAALRNGARPLREPSNADSLDLRPRCAVNPLLLTLPTFRRSSCALLVRRHVRARPLHIGALRAHDGPECRRRD
jgi:hypothetical protein